MSNAPRTPTRNQIASIAGNDPRSVRALEQLFTQVSGVIPDELQATKEVAEYAQTEAAQAYTSANEALGASVRTSDAATSAQLEAAQAYRTANEALGASVRAVDAVTAAQLEAAQAYRAANEALSSVQTLADGLKKKEPLDDPVITGKITGDFTSSPSSGGVSFQTNLANSATYVVALPSGTSNTAGFTAYSTLDGITASAARLYTTGTDVRLASSAVGGGAYVPLTLEAGGVSRLRFFTDGKILAVSPAPIGYGPGSGGMVTQSTSKSTSVALNRPAGRIVMANDALAANTSVSFVLNNSQITTEDCLVCCIVGFTNYSVAVNNVSTGQAVITVTNITASPLSDAIQINFVVIKGAFD